MRPKDFGMELAFFRDKIERKEPFSLARFGDGELAILRGDEVGNREFQFDPNDHGGFRDELWHAFTYQHPGYYVGICCPCCVGNHDFQWQVEHSMQDLDNLTWNNIWCNANYPLFMEAVVPLFKKFDGDVLLIANDESNHKLLPFGCDMYPVPNNAWRFFEYHVQRLDEVLEEHPYQLVLCAAGPLSEVIIHRQYTGDGIMLDIGSTLDPIMLNRQSRGYLSGGPTSRKVCTWGQHAILNG